MPLLSRLAVQAARAYGILSAADKTKVTASYLVVAGGGGGGFDIAGGGGAGGYQTSTATLSTLNTYSITVGAGGAGATSNSAQGTNGGVSSLSGTGLTTVTSTGGGGGGTNNTSLYAGVSGGSGGGSTNGASAGTGTSGQGNAGGVGTTALNAFSGGGGGAGAVGGAGSSSGGNGGNGLASSISGSSVTYAGGGGGGAYTGTRGTGGTGGGGNGGPDLTVGSDGSVNLGGGGGGGGRSRAGGAGGSGVVIISYASATPRFVGGTLTTSGGNQIHTFTSSGTLSPLTPVTASYLVVAGGGAAANGGGGGAGGMLTGSTTIYSGATYVVTVGAGGAGQAGGVIGNNGSNSVLSGTGLTTLTSTGGGGGSQGGVNGANGGSGGGGRGTGRTGGTGISGQGFAGGDGSAGNSGGGGGGAGAVGSNSSGGNGGNGGIGATSSISGTSTFYAGGGGGGGDTTAGTGGTGGGGSGSVNAAGVSGTTNTGGGGGGIWNGTPAGSGGSGVVIISYAGSQVFNGGLVTSSGGNTIHTFTATGALTPLTNNLTNSLRFRSSASAFLSRTPASAGNRKTWTWSSWIKRGELATRHDFFSAGTASNNTDTMAIRFDTSANLTLAMWSADIFQTTQLFRDPSAWYHIVLAMDTTQATAANRVKLYINGNQVTNFTSITYPSQNADLGINGNVAHNIGRLAFSGGAFYFDGYMTDINFIDGQALEPYYFGNNDANGVWKPIQYRGTYGTNGFYLNFSNTTSTTTLGNDSSGNGNNWTTNNISLTAGTTYDAMTDVPTNTSATVANYAVWNPLVLFANTTYQSTMSNANMLMTRSGAGLGGAVTTIGATSGKYYAEMTVTAVGSSTPRIGIVASDNPSSVNSSNEFSLGVTSTSIGYLSNGSRYTNNTTTTSWGSTYTTNDVIGVAFDADTGKIWFSKNNTWQASGDPAAGTNPATTLSTGVPFYFAAAGESGASISFNTGQRPLSYTPPTGFVALNTYNLP